MKNDRSEDSILKKINKVMRKIGCGGSVARELLTIAGWDVDLVVDMSESSCGLDQCKARIINERFSRLETK